METAVENELTIISRIQQIQERLNIFEDAIDDGLDCQQLIPMACAVEEDMASLVANMVKTYTLRQATEQLLKYRTEEIRVLTRLAELYRR